MVRLPFAVVDELTFGKEGTESDRDGGPASNDESQVFDPQHRTLRTGLRILYPLHVAHPPLSRHDGAPFADEIPGWWTLSQSGEVRGVV